MRCRPLTSTNAWRLRERCSPHAGEPVLRDSSLTRQGGKKVHAGPRHQSHYVQGVCTAVVSAPAAFLASSRDATEHLRCDVLKRIVRMTVFVSCPE